MKMNDENNLKYLTPPNSSENKKETNRSKSLNRDGALIDSKYKVTNRNKNNNHNNNNYNNDDQSSCSSFTSTTPHVPKPPPGNHQKYSSHQQARYLFDHLIIKIFSNFLFKFKNTAV